MRSTTATRSIDEGDDGDKIERVELDRVYPISEANEIERLPRRAVMVTRSNDRNEIECILFHEADEIETQNLKMLNPQQESQLFPTLMEEVCVQAYIRATTLPTHIFFDLQW
ncbi:constitutive photomorphogenesis protein 10-like isoform X1 [Raphanus sativus]|nr:constitutive photomorphogenesis protein 10-like isoform X1 [Raphanus sativus]